MRFYLCLALLTATAILLVISYATWRNRRVPGARSCSLLMLAAAIYVGASAFALTSQTLEQVRFWIRVEYLGVPFISALWLVLVLQFTGFSSFLTRRTYALIFAIPVLTFVAHSTNEYHHLVYTNIYLDRVEPITTATLIKGPIYWLYVAYAYAVVFTGTILFVRMYLQSTDRIRRQIVLLVLTGLVPWLLHTVYISGLLSLQLDLTPLGLAMSGVLISLGILRFNLLRLTPIALTRVFESMGDGVIILDDDDYIAKCNRQAAMIFPELVGNDVERRAIHDVLRDRTDLLALLGRSGDFQTEYEAGHGETMRSYKLSVSRLVDHGRSIGRLLTFTDITPQKQLVAQWNELALTDELTGLPNRRSFRATCERELDEARSSGRPVSVMILDLDHFKAVNDSFGHHVGDDVLRQVTALLRRHVRPTDTVARIGGEEFVVLLPGTSPSAALDVAERLREGIARHLFTVGDSVTGLTASLGVFGLDTVTSEGYMYFVQEADRALYRAKKEGRNRVFLAD